ncbi:MAG: DUF541 domain-containing protein [Actinobacteria bacterium]|nr:DUF541 domain-containing protein [Actinomycetota bacterium]
MRMRHRDPGRSQESCVVVATLGTSLNDPRFGSVGAVTQSNNESRLLPVALAMVLLAAALAWGLHTVGDGIARRGGDTVSVRGQAIRNVKADRAVWKLSVSQTADTAAAAISGVSDGVNIVLAFLKKNSVADDAVTIGGVSSYSNKEYIDGNATGRALNYSLKRWPMPRCAPPHCSPPLILRSARCVQCQAVRFKSLPETRPMSKAAAITTRPASKKR